MLSPNLDDELTFLATAAPTKVDNDANVLHHQLVTSPLLTYSTFERHMAEFPSRGLLGTSGNERVYINTNATNSTVICGIQGSGKSHTVSCLLECALISDSRIGKLPEPLSGLVFHFDEQDTGRPCEAAFLSSQAEHLNHVSLPQVVVLCSNFEQLRLFLWFHRGWRWRKAALVRKNGLSAGLRKNSYFPPALSQHLYKEAVEGESRRSESDEKIPQSGFSQWSNITIAMRAKRESRQEAVLTYSVALIIKYSRSSSNESEEEGARWFLDIKGSRVEWTFSDSFSARLISLAFQVIEDLPEAMKQTCYSPILIGTLITLFLERAFGEEGIRTLKMMDQAENLNQTVKTLHFVLVNELGPCGGEQYEGLGEELDGEGHFLPLPPGVKERQICFWGRDRNGFVTIPLPIRAYWIRFRVKLRDIASLLFRDNQADGDFWEDKRDRKDGGSDEWTHPHGSEGDGDPSENEENGIYEF
ncbi:hypothetical protein B0H14DRAFT_3174002, partial [Mycena olivaceomarginata]